MAATVTRQPMMFAQIICDDSENYECYCVNAPPSSPPLSPITDLPPAPPLAPSVENFHGGANYAWEQTITLEANLDQIVYFRSFYDNGYLEDGDWVVYVGFGMGCSASVRANYAIDQGEGQDHGGIISADANGVLSTTVNMIKRNDHYQACYYKPRFTTLPNRRRKLEIVYDGWGTVQAYIVIRTTPSPPPFPPSPSSPPCTSETAA